MARAVSGAGAKRDRSNYYTLINQQTMIPEAMCDF